MNYIAMAKTALVTAATAVTAAKIVMDTASGIINTVGALTPAVNQINNTIKTQYKKLTTKGVDMPDKYKKYPKTEMYRIIDSITTPHPFCISPHLVAHASDYFGGLLSAAAIEDYESKKGAGSACAVKGCNLSYAEHETGLVVEVGFQDDLNEAPGLPKFLEECAAQAEKDGISGFVFVQKHQEVTHG